MSNETTPGLGERIEEAIEWDGCIGPDAPTTHARVMAVVQPELDRRDVELKQLRKERDDARASVRALIDQDLYDSLAEAVEFQAERGEQYRTAWWSARIRAARNDQHGDLLRKALGTAIGERDQLKATLDRVRGIANTWARSRAGLDDMLVPAGCFILATLDQPEEVPAPLRLREPSETELARLKQAFAEVLATFGTAKSSPAGEVIGYLAPAAPIHPDDWRAALDRSDLPAGREFAAGFDPREEPT